MQKINTLPTVTIDIPCDRSAVVLKLDNLGILRAVDTLPYDSREGGYQGGAIDTWDLSNYVQFKDVEGNEITDDALFELIGDEGPWSIDYEGEYSPYDYEDNGPSEQEIEDQMIEAQIERQEEDLRGENGPEAQREAEEAIRHNKIKEIIRDARMREAQLEAKEATTNIN